MSHKFSRLGARAADYMNCLLRRFPPLIRSMSLTASGQGITVGKCREKLVQSFLEADVSEPESSAQYIIAHAIKKKTLHDVSNEMLLEPSTVQMISEYADLRKKKSPVQYVIGEWDFHDLTLACKPPVFIPRPETEILVDEALSDSVVQSAKSFIEVGPGTGAISIYLLTKLAQARATVIEISAEACELTEMNARSLGVNDRLTIINAPFSANVSLESLSLTEQVDFLISNPPYTASPALDSLQPEINWFEDLGAQDGGHDGMDIVKDILQTAALLVRPCGSVWLEVDTPQPPIIQRLTNCNPAYKLAYIRTLEDLQKSPRFCHLQVLA